MKRNRPNLIWGVLLILVGGFFLAMNAGIVPELTESLWGIFFAVIALLFLAGYLSSDRRQWGLLFPTTIFGAIALTIWLVSVDVEGNIVGGIFLIAVSIPFWVGYMVNRQKHWGLLIPGWILAIIGAIVLFIGERSDEWVGAMVLFALALPFFVVYLSNRRHWWALIPGWVLSVLGVIVLLADSADGEVIGALFMFATALPFLVVYLARRDQWWALIPTGALTTIGVIVLLSMIDMSEAAEVRVIGGLIFAGIGMTFALLWIMRERYDTDWAKYPAAALCAAALLIAVSGAWFEYAWPVVLIGTGLWLLARRSAPPKEKYLQE